ncbi:acyl-CoA dehydrogenase C-terminal domain-containing protein [Methylobrevis albus]|uniref:3-methylmercaptopropionyl-CoA dehydrogenase n=1 Tax=Methylobrevis albus TaxID=2793297 RepID=A0A931MWN3_9HYPH|nr:acyl-CoA dehydrogenase C-terminal domain-containing protein [Methylobrevis albus]MBH0237443.1 acyl-CoA dehydrogenase C-terminal domain-containing protein [Methylobrevis albus]
MPSYRAPVADSLFIVNDVLRLADHAELPGFAEATPDVVTAVLSEAGRFADEVLQPLNQRGDAEGCRRGADGSVATPAGFREAYARYRATGVIGIAADPAYGGLGLPYVLASLINEFASGANLAFSLYPGLTQSAISALAEHGSEAQRALYLPRLVDGSWTGTMNLTEPHCGTDLGLLRTRAAANDDGSYALHGEKSFISAGEHDLAENIVHLVLARIDGAVAGTRGLSLFVVPKFIPGADGRPGQRNAVTCGGIEAKMGIHGNATCTMLYEGATGWLVGTPGAGLKAMFTMMNEARLGVAGQGLALGEVAGQNAAAYARERRQGRALGGAAEPAAGADPIVVHPDVRRMLMTMRAFTEGGRALMLWGALQSDISRRSADPAVAARAADLLGLLTPVAKAVLTDRGFEAAVMAQQVYGGHGYIAGNGVEQFVRDARITMIYEGTNGIQALDLVGRKLGKDGGRAVIGFFKELKDYVGARSGDAALAPFVAPLGRAAGDLERATMWFMANAMKAPDNAGAGASDYIHLFGLTAMGWMWARMAETAAEKLARGEGDPAFLAAKLDTGRFFMERLLPETALRRTRIEAGAASTMALPADLF